VRLSLPLATGSAIHRGVEVLLKIDQVGLPLAEVLRGYEGESPVVSEGLEPIDIAVAAALAEFNQAYSTHEVDATVNESTQFIHDEHAALIEGLLRLWAEHPDGLPWLLSQYEVLEVERWDFKTLVEGRICEHCVGGYLDNTLDAYGDKIKCGACIGVGSFGGITLRSRADALLRKRSDGGLYVWSLKTANSWDKRRDDSGRHDVQGISEMVCIEERLSAEWAQQSQLGDVPQPRIDGTQMTYLLKGRRELDENLNVYRIKTALLHPWCIDAGLLGEKAYAHTYWYNCELPHDTGRTLKSGKAVLCEGGKRHNIGTSWSQCNVWQDMSMKEWVALLLSGQVQPELPMPTLIINPEPYFRNSLEVSDWLEQVTAQEQLIQVGLAAVGEAENEDQQRSALNKFFPQYRKSCDHDFGGVCKFVDMCFGPSAVADDPVGSGLYKLRERVDHDVE